ncbi:MAG: ABC transporter permease [Paracoccaceae bacterium]|nr:ABC transporter permease [Paracoccaceae bacterium]
MTEATEFKAESPAREAWRMFRRNIPAVAGVIMLTGIVLATLWGTFFYGGNPYEIVWAPHEPPGVTPEFPFGTDYLGRDIFAGLIAGGGPTLAVGAAAAAITMVIGVSLGALAGFYGGWVDNLLMRITEFFQVLPTLLFAMVLVTLFSPTLFTIAMAIGVVSWPQTARLTRAEVMKIKELEYVTAARAIGARNRRIIWTVILPNAAPPLIVSATLTIGVAILFEAGLSFLGLGDPNTMSWGLMIGSNRAYILDAWWPVTFPGLAIFLTVFSVSLIGDGLNDAFNPKLRER